MKKYIYSCLVMAFMFINAKAAVLTVSNSPAKPATFTTIAAAMTAANSGDTIFVSGTPNDYGDVKIKKPLTLIGQGHPPANVQVPATTIDYLDIYSDNVTVIGFNITQNINYNSQVKCSNIDIERNYVAYTLYVRDSSTNWIIANNFLYRVGGPSSTAVSNILVLNNVFFHFSVAGFLGNVSIKNNLFLNTTSFGTLSNATISNNIFYGTQAVSSSVDNSTFKNNISLEKPGSGPSSYDSIPGGTNAGSGNFISKDPGFTSIDGTDRYSPFNPKNDYHLKSSSLGHNAGTDGTDIGIYGGSKPVKAFGGDPALPLITEFDIVNVIVPQGGKLNFSVKAKKQQ